MRATRGISVVIAAFLLLVAACSGDDAGDTSTTEAAATTTTAAGPDETTTTAPGAVTTTTSGRTNTTTTAADGSDSTTTTLEPDTTSSTSTSSTSTTSTTTTRAPSDAVEARPPTAGCPTDLFLTTDDFGEASDNVLAAYVPPGQTPVWEIPLGYNAVAGFATNNNRLFALLADGRLIAVDVADCAEAWRKNLGTGPVFGGVAVEDDIVVVTGAGRVAAFDTDSGEQLWSETTVTPARAPLLREGIAVIAGATAPWLRSYWMETGERLFDNSAGFTGTIEAIEADFDAIYVAGDGTVEGRWIDDGTRLFGVSSDLTAAMAIFDIYVYVTDGNDVAALDFDTGEEQWSTSFSNPLLSTIGIGGDSVLVFEQSGRAHRLDFDTGESTPGGSYGAFAVWPEFDDGAFVVWDGGKATVYNLFEEAMFELPTGANGVDRFTHIEVAAEVVVTWSFSAERF